MIFLVMAMNKDATEIVKEIGSQIWLVVYRIPKKNHNAMVLNWKQVNGLIRKHGGSIHRSSNSTIERPARMRALPT
jgi:hypothetical protein